jgi:hypothetical protein
MDWKDTFPSLAPACDGDERAIARGTMSGFRSGLVGVVALLATGLGACGSTEKNPVVARVDGKAITRTMVDRWTGVVQRGGAFTGFRGVAHTGNARQRALVLLISSNWLIGEARRQGVPVSDKEVNGALAERMQGSAAAGFRKRLKRTGQTIAGVRVELRAEMALDGIRESLARRATQFSQSDVVSFYRRNSQRFSDPKVSVVDIIENLPSAAAATALVKRIGTGRRFEEMAYHKELAYTPGVLAGAVSKKEVDRAIFAARPGVVSQPMRLFNGWTVFVVRKVIPPRPRPLAAIRSEVVVILKQQRKRDISDAFAKEFRSRWVGRTSCRDGYVVSGCAQYAGPLGSYENPFATP